MAFTYFLRDMQTLERVVEHVVPYTSGRNRVQVWDAGCAMGQEPYSLAMLFAENMGHFAFKNLRIHATDLDDCSLFGEIIRTGLYQEEEVKRMPRELLEKYFQPDDKAGCFRISELLRSRIQFKKHDLLSLIPIGDGFSLIVCKNVLLHFHFAERVEVIRMFHGSLAPGGFFATEQTQKMPGETAHLFEQISGDAQLFRKVADR
ncbi:MAG: CheR family methyltransferase [Syntrophobacteraceae bacterium]|jgi:chemotaxis protein methyltransferase CheR